MNSNKGQTLQIEQDTWAWADSSRETISAWPAVKLDLSERIFSKYCAMVANAWGERLCSIDSRAWPMSRCNKPTALRSRHARKDVMHSHNFCKRIMGEQEILKLDLDEISRWCEIDCISFTRHMDHFWARVIVVIKCGTQDDALRPSLSFIPKKSIKCLSSNAEMLITFEKGHTLPMIDAISGCERQSLRDDVDMFSDDDAIPEGMGVITLCAMEH